jgi:hypothetical protein
MLLPTLRLARSDNKATSVRHRGAASRFRRWFSTRHSLRTEAFGVLAFYATYEASRGLVVDDRQVAIAHGHAIASLEHRLHVFVEPTVQHAVHALPELLPLLGGAYLTLHLSVTAAVLLWLHWRRPAAYAQVRTTLFLASAIALVGFVLYPAAPPRLVAVGLADTISGRHIDLNKGLISSLYNPFAAVPSLHMGYALVVGAALARQARKRVTRMAGLAYPLLVLLVIVATGNHYFFDAFAGALVAAIASALASAITNQSAASAARPAATTTPPPRVTALPVPAVTHIRHERSEQKLAA